MNKAQEFQLECIDDSIAELESDVEEFRADVESALNPSFRSFRQKTYDDAFSLLCEARKQREALLHAIEAEDRGDFWDGRGLESEER